MQIILHIGQQKTASTTLQTFLSQNGQQLAAKKILYPRTLGVKNASRLKDYLFGINEGENWYNDNAISMREEFAGDYIKAIISDENLISLEGSAGRDSLRRIKEIFKPYATSWRVLCYIRRPDDHITSNYQQVVRRGYIGNFDQYFEEVIGGSYYNYVQWLDGWAEVFGEGVVEARLFHRKTQQDGPIRDFLQWAGVDREGLSFEAPSHARESLDRLNTEILRFLHFCQAQHPEVLHGHRFKRMLERLVALDNGDRLRLDMERAKRLQAQFRADHQHLAARYLPPDHAAILLAPPDEAPPQTPLDSDALVDRMMTLFNDPNLARMAADTAEQPAPPDLRYTSKRLPHPKNNAKENRAKRRRGREARKQKRREPEGVTAAGAASLASERHEFGDGGLAGRTARVFQQLKDRLTGKAR